MQITAIDIATDPANSFDLIYLFKLLLLLLLLLSLLLLLLLTEQLKYLGLVEVIFKVTGCIDVLLNF